MCRANFTASSQIRWRNSGSRFGAGAISTTFWWRRCTEQSRSYRWITSPVASASTCTSMWRGRRTACSRYIRESPKADSASRIASASASGSPELSSTRRMPRPPPPLTALTNTGNPMSSAAASRVSMSSLGSEPLRVGRPASCAAWIARALLPVSSRISWVGPMNAMPASSQAWARSGFSERKP